MEDAKFDSFTLSLLTTDPSISRYGIHHLRSITRAIWSSEEKTQHTSNPKSSNSVVYGVREAHLRGIPGNSGRFRWSPGLVVAAAEQGRAAVGASKTGAKDRAGRADGGGRTGGDWQGACAPLLQSRA